MTQHTFEQTVLAYLDGMLDRREEHDFLDAVRRDPEKRALLEQYQLLRDTLEKQRSSYLPAHTERALAKRIPALRNIPLLEDASFVHASKGLHSLLSIRRISVLLIAGAALFTLLSVLQQTGRSPEASVNSPQNTTSLSRNGVSTRNGKADAVGEEIESWTNSVESGKTDVKAAVWDDQRTSSMQGYSLHRRVNRQGNAVGERAYQHGGTIGNQVNGASGAQAGLPDNAVMAATFATIRVKHGSTAMRGIARFPLANPGEIIVHEQPLQVARTFFGRKLQVCFESGAEMREMMRGDRRLGNEYSAQYLVGLRWEFDPFMAAGVEVGQSVLAREGQTVRTLTMEDSPDMDVIIVENVLKEEERSWVRAHIFYTFNPGDLFQIQATAGSGLLLGSDRNVMFSLGAAVQYPFLSNVYIRAGLHYSGTWLGASGVTPVLPTAGGNPVAFKFPSENPGRTYNSSIQFRIGAGYLLW